MVVVSRNKKTKPKAPLLAADWIAGPPLAKNFWISGLNAVHVRLQPGPASYGPVVGTEGMTDELFFDQEGRLCELDLFVIPASRSPTPTSWLEDMRAAITSSARPGVVTLVRKGPMRTSGAWFAMPRSNRTRTSVADVPSAVLISYEPVPYTDDPTDLVQCHFAQSEIVEAAVGVFVGIDPTTRALRFVFVENLIPRPPPDDR